MYTIQLMIIMSTSRSAVCIGCVRAMSSWFSHILDYEPYDPGVHSWLLNFRGG